MFTLIAENKYGEQLELTHSEAYVITNIDGIDPPEAVINSTRNAGADGSVFNSAYVDNRVITITLAINAPAELNRINLYKYFKSKQKVKLYYKNYTRNVCIEGYVQNIPINYFEKKQIAQIIIFCPNPFFNESIDKVTNFETVTSLFQFPFEIETPIPFSSIATNTETNVINAGDVETGMIITLRASGAVVNPAIYDVDTGEYFKINKAMAAGDVITINTKDKEKSITLLSNGVLSNIIGNIEYGSTWLKLRPGDNIMLITATTLPENLISSVSVINQYEGV